MKVSFKKSDEGLLLLFQLFHLTASFDIQPMPVVRRALLLICSNHMTEFCCQSTRLVHDDIRTFHRYRPSSLIYRKAQIQFRHDLWSLDKFHPIQQSIYGCQDINFRNKLLLGAENRKKFFVNKLKAIMLSKVSSNK